MPNQNRAYFLFLISTSMTKFSVFIAISLTFWCFFSCKEILPKGLDDDQILDGTVEGLTEAELIQFERGDEAFREVFVKETGLGPSFVTASCVSCHAGDGKGHPFTTLTRFGQPDELGNQFMHLGGPQLQNRALPGYEPEIIPLGATFAKFTPPANTGLGYLEYVSDADILAMADPNDDDKDNISGEPNYGHIPDYLTKKPDAIPKNDKYILRFGKKAAAYNLLHQTANAYNQDMGITSSYESIDAFTLKEIEPEITVNKLNDVVFYLETLKAPIQRNTNDPIVQNGLMVFKEIGCEKCHKQTLKTGKAPIDALSEKEFHPYTDLLLHDMGSGLDDGYTEASAKTYEWRTPPLWGLGLSSDSQGGAYYLMHDGRARSIEAAILLHGGEALFTKTKYESLSESEKAALITFLNSL
jgi:CxxC motif-containing protein (DUF1111 family)